MAPLTDRARRYVEAMPPAVSGQNGHQTTFSAAVALLHGFALSEGEAWPILMQYAARCQPPWNIDELRHKLASAGKLTRHSKPRGHLAGKQITGPSRRPVVISIPALFTAPPAEAYKPPRIHGIVRCPPKPEQPRTVAPAPEPDAAEAGRKPQSAPGPRPQPPQGWGRHNRRYDELVATFGADAIFDNADPAQLSELMALPCYRRAASGGKRKS